MDPHHPPPPLLPPTPNEELFARSLQGTVRKVLDCERSDVQQAWRQALAQPLAALVQEEAESDASAIQRALLSRDAAAAAQASPQQQPQPLDAARDPERVVRLLLELFKHKGFFTWVDAPPCPDCSSRGGGGGGGSGNDSNAPPAPPPPHPPLFLHVEPPNESERLDDPTVSRVEVYRCPACGSERARFARHASALALLRERRGRCGEWAHAFLAALRSLGVEARHVQDREDHVWTEYWRPGGSTMGRWIHADSCEGAHDAPGLYERGWGKKLTFAVAVGRAGGRDVSLRYCGVAAAAEGAGATRAEAQRCELEARRQGGGVREAWLEQCLERQTRWLRRRMRAAAASPPMPPAGELRRRDAADALDLVLRAWGFFDGAAAGGAEGGGRTSGSEAWRAARGEDGGGAKAETVAAAAPPPPTTTPWAWAREAETLRAPAMSSFLRACGRVTGGAVRASADNAAAGETAAAALEGRAAGGCKWLAFFSSRQRQEEEHHWLEYHLPLAASPQRLASYDLISANDAPERDPAAWVVERLCEGDEGGGEDGGGRWEAADERDGEEATFFSRRHQLRSFFLAQPAAPGRAWRLRVRRVVGGSQAECVQLGGWALYHHQDDSTAATTTSTTDNNNLADAARAVRALAASSAAAPPSSDSNDVRVSGAERCLRMASDGAACALLAAAGFRPLALAAGELALVADPRAAGAQARAVAALQEASGTSSV